MKKAAENFARWSLRLHTPANLSAETYSVDPDQTAIGTARYGSTLFVKNASNTSVDGMLDTICDGRSRG